MKEPDWNALAAWYRREHRRLPWRETRDPYAIWVSEVMLQQTRVETVLRYYGPFLRRFPTLQDLASAPVDAVLKAWEGMGYYGRVRNLLAGARHVLERGGWPREVPQLVQIPGIGRSTAGALASFAFGLPSPILDGNVKRVWARFYKMDEIISSNSLSFMWKCSEQAAAFSDPSLINQALMELGATTCVPRAPACTRCPISLDCLAARTGEPSAYPKPRRRKSLPHYEVAVGVLWSGGRFLIQRRPEKGLLGGLWELPGGKVEEDETPEGALRREFLEELALEVIPLEPLETVRHAYSHFSVRLHPFCCALAPHRGPYRLPQGVGDEISGVTRDSSTRWIGPDEVADLPFPAATRKILGGLFPEARALARAADEPAPYMTRGRKGRTPSRRG